MCFDKPRLPIRKQSEKTEAISTATKHQWYKENPPAHNGTWTCYLQIAPECPVLVTHSTIQQEHVKPKVHYKELRYVLINIKPACQDCNKLKGSTELEKLAKSYPRIKAMLLQPEWKQWEIEVQKFVQPELH